MCASLLNTAVNALVSAVAGGGMALLGVKYGYELSLRHETKMRKRAFRTQITSLSAELKQAKEGSVYYIHSSGLSTLQKAGADVLADIQPGSKNNFVKLMEEYAGLQQPNHKENEGLREEQKTPIKAAKERMLKILEELEGLAK